MDDDFIFVRAPHNAKPWVTLPMSEVEIDETKERNEMSEFGSPTSAVDVQFRHRLLEAGARVTITGTRNGSGFNERMFKYCTQNVIPIFIYAISTSTFKFQVSF